MKKIASATLIELNSLEQLNVFGAGECKCAPPLGFTYNYPSIKHCIKKCCKDFPPRTFYT